MPAGVEVTVPLPTRHTVSVYRLAVKVAVTVDGQPYCEATVDAQGRFGCEGSTPLAEGPHTFSVTATDAAGLTAVIVDVETQAALSAFELIERQLPGGGKNQTIALVDAGSSVMSLTVLRNGQQVYAREQAFGGGQLTQDIARHYGMTYEEAEAAKVATQAVEVADRIGYPVLVRPSYVLGGRGMEIVYDEQTLQGYIERATELSPEHPVLVDRFLEDAIEIDVDALCDGTEVYIGGVMEHIEEAGIHSGDSACALPPVTLGRADLQMVRESTEALAKGIGVKGLLNVQYALKDDILYVLEANPRASRTVPFVSKATAVPLAKACARVMLGSSIAQLREQGILPPTGDGGEAPAGVPIAVKEAVLPFNRFRREDGTGVDTLLSPEMKSTGEVMGIDSDFGKAFAKSQSAAYGSLPTSGAIFVSVANKDKRALIFPVKHLADLGFTILATEGTADVLRRNGITCTTVRKHFEAVEGEQDIVEKIKAGEVAMVINTPYGNSGPRVDGYEIRSAAVSKSIPCITTVQGASAAVQGIEAAINGAMGVESIQSRHGALIDAR